MPLLDSLDVLWSEPAEEGLSSLLLGFLFLVVGVGTAVSITGVLCGLPPLGSSPFLFWLKITGDKLNNKEWDKANSISEVIIEG